MAGQGPRPVPLSERQRRVEYLAPLVAYLLERRYVAGLIAEDALERARLIGEATLRSQTCWLAKMKRGDATIPPWFVEQCCAVIGKSVEEVMGAEWITRFGADGRGGAETAPTGAPRLQRPWGVQTHQTHDRAQSNTGSSAA